MSERPKLSETTEFVRVLFRDVRDKGGQPYDQHCIRVAAHLTGKVSDDALHAALLHDVVEDTAITIDDLRSRGYSERTLWLVDRLTRRPEDGTYLEWIRSIADTGDHELVLIKLSDNLDNSDPARIEALPSEQSHISQRYAPARQILEAALPSTAGPEDRM